MKLSSVICIVLLIVSCSPVKVVTDKFDNSASVKLDLKGGPDYGNFKTLYGNLKIVRILFRKDYNSGLFSDINLFCKFEGYQGELFDGDAIELNTDGKIHSLKLTEARLGEYEQELGGSITMFTRIGAFTFADSTRSNVHIIVMEMPLSKGIQEAILAAKKIMIRIFTKNIDGNLKNGFAFRRLAVANLKRFILFQTPTK